MTVRRYMAQKKVDMMVPRAETCMVVGGWGSWLVWYVCDGSRWWLLAGSFCWEECRRKRVGGGGGGFIGRPETGSLWRYQRGCFAEQYRALDSVRRHS